eukprot:792624-Prorocentrum_minimum.AAC.1
MLAELGAEMNSSSSPSLLVLASAYTSSVSTFISFTFLRTCKTAGGGVERVRRACREGEEGG